MEKERKEGRKENQTEKEIDANSGKKKKENL